jgi:drug/metabolite transporter (DMT)-like permease
VPVVFAANVILLRRIGAAADMVPTVFLGGLFALSVALPLGWPLTASWPDVGVLAVMGIGQLGLGCLFFTLAVPHLSAAEIGLLSLLETTLGPVWVWLGIGERPSAPALFGGAMVIISLVVNEIAGMQRASRVSSGWEKQHYVPRTQSEG